MLKSDWYGVAYAFVQRIHCALVEMDPSSTVVSIVNTVHQCGKSPASNACGGVSVRKRHLTTLRQPLFRREETSQKNSCHFDSLIRRWSPAVAYEGLCGALIFYLSKNPICIHRAAPKLKTANTSFAQKQPRPGYLHGKLASLAARPGQRMQDSYRAQGAGYISGRKRTFDAPRLTVISTNRSLGPTEQP